MHSFRLTNPYAGSGSSMSSSTPADSGSGTGFSGQSSITHHSAFGTSSRITHNLNNSIDPETAALTASLLYGDLQDILAQRKGKSREGGPLSDADYALLLQSEQLEGMLNETQDANIARRMQDAMRLDQVTIAEILLSEKVAQQDHEAALAMSKGHEMPRMTREQTAIDRGLKRVDGVMSTDLFEALSPRLKPTPVSSLSKGKEKVVIPSPPLSPISLPGPLSTFDMVNVKRAQCVSCDDKIPVWKSSLQAPCGHHYCTDCLADLVRAATSDESLFPVRCCRMNIPPGTLSYYLSNALLTVFRERAKEFGTPTNVRVYCCNPTCSAFLGNAEEAKQQSQNRRFSWYLLLPATSAARLSCEKCRVETCVHCRRRAHSNHTCQQDRVVQRVGMVEAAATFVVVAVAVAVAMLVY